MNYHKRKREAERAIGVAEVRPQDEYREFLKHLRNLNQKGGSWVMPMDKVKEMRSRICGSCVPSLLMPTINPLDSPTFVPYTVVETAEEFKEFMAEVSKETFIAMDFEFHKEYSYNGFIATIQVATSGFNFVLDPFKLHPQILNEFVPKVLENTSILKVMCGLQNDALFCQSNFSGFLITAIDVQDVYEQWKLEHPTECFLKTKEAFRDHIIQRRRAKNPKTAVVRPTEEEVSLEWGKNEPISYKKLVESLFKSHGVKIDKKLQLADFRVRPVDKFAKYVVEDVHYLYLVFVELQKMVSTEGIKKAFSSTKLKLMKTFTETKYPSAYTMLGSLKSLKTQEQQSVFCRLHAWRDDIAKVMDEAPDNLMRASEMVQLCLKTCELGDVTTDVVASLLIRNTNSTTKKQIGRLVATLNNDQTYLNHTAEIVCHNCFGRGHQGWSCPHPHDKSANKNFLDLPENWEYREKQAYRRAKNRFRNTQKWNWGIPDSWKSQILDEIEQEERQQQEQQDQ